MNNLTQKVANKTHFELTRSDGFAFALEASKQASVGLKFTTNIGFSRRV
jgi:hypothetical protein